MKRSILALAAVALIGQTLAAVAPALPPPNILWVVIEDTSPRFVGPYGDPLARTPVADRLAQKGIVFDHVYTAPVCAPSRSTLATGRYAHSMGTQHMRSTQPLPDGVRFFSEYLRAAGYFCTNNAKTDYNTSTSWADAWDANGTHAHWRNRGAGQPFFAMFSFNRSHEQHLHARHPLVTDPTKVRVPAYLPDSSVVRADLAQNYDNVAAVDAVVGQVIADLEADGLAEDTIVFYFGDHGGALAGSKRFLNDHGTHAPLVVYFPPKYAHLAPAAPGTRMAEQINFVDFSPTMLSLAGQPLSSSFQGRAFAGAARQSAPEYTFMFRGRMDERFDEARAVTDGRFRYVRNYYPDRPWGQRIDYLWRQAAMQDWHLQFRAGTLNPAQRRFFEPKAAEELYDCASDPDNVRNLARDPAQRETLLRFRAALRQHQLAVRDTGLLPETMMIEAAAGRSPTVITVDDKFYPLSRILDTVDALQLGEAANRHQLASSAAADPLPVIRYWAAVAALAEPGLFEVHRLLTDPNSTVRLTAAEAILRQSEDDNALKEVNRALVQTAEPELRLFALNALDRIPRKPPQTFRSLLGQLAAADARGGIDYYLARTARPLLAR